MSFYHKRLQLLLAVTLTSLSLTNNCHSYSETPPPANELKAPTLGSDTPNKEFPSQLEEFYSTKAKVKLKQFGYDLFTHQPTNLETPIASTTGNYELGNGDILEIVIRGQKNETSTHHINAQGQIIIDDLPPITATGLSLTNLSQRLNQEIASWPNTNIYVSLQKFRQISVLTLGHVHKPGRKNLSSAHTLLDALAASQGIEKTGSLRNVTLLRAGKKHIIDLYDILIGQEQAPDISLQNGDRIIIPSIGDTLAISGDVKRTGIFEIRKDETLKTISKLSGGSIAKGNIRYIKTSASDSQDITSSNEAMFLDGDILHVKRAEDKPQNTIRITGHSTQTGLHDLSKNQKISHLLKHTYIYKDNLYPLFALIERTNPNNLLKQYITISPTLITAGHFDLSLMDNDNIILFSKKDIERALASNDQIDKNENTAPLAPHIVNLIKEHCITIDGAIRQEGLLPISQGTTLSDIIAAAGGTTLEANIANIEITSSSLGTGHQDNQRSGTSRKTLDLRDIKDAAIILRPGDSIRVNTKLQKLAHNKVTITGEILSPGEYDLLPQDTYADLIKRAGGLTRQAYPQGAIFSRASERKREEKRYKDKARDLELQLALLLDSQDADKKPDMAQVTLIQGIITQLNNAEAVGRITIQADPGILQNDPAQNILLEQDDRIYIPKRPLTVRVIGEVLSPASLQYRDNKTVTEYIKEAGGTTYYADKDRTFVIHPDGSAQPVKVGAWAHNPITLTPGSTLMVPKDPKPFDFLETAKDISHILSNLAITGIYLDEIGDD